MSAINDYIAGAVGGAAGLFVGHPFDTTKVQLQTQQTSSPYKSTWEAVKNINNHGLSRGFFRGLAFPLTSYGIVNSVFFGVYGNAHRWLTKGKEKGSYLDVYLAGCIGGAAQLIPACPVDVVKVILQSQIPKSAETTLKNRQHFKGPIQCVSQVIKQHGLRMCIRGWNVQAPRDVIASGLYFLSYEYLFVKLKKASWTDDQDVVASFIAGGTAGVLSWSAIMPLDVVKSVYQADLFEQRYKNVYQCARDVYMSGGARAFYSGLIMCCVRAFPVNAVTFLVYQQCMKILQPASKT